MKNQESQDRDPNNVLVANGNLADLDCPKNASIDGGLLLPAVQAVAERPLADPRPSPKWVSLAYLH